MALWFVAWPRNYDENIFSTIDEDPARKGEGTLPLEECSVNGQNPSFFLNLFDTPSKFNSSPLKMDGWKLEDDPASFGGPVQSLFRGHVKNPEFYMVNIQSILPHGFDFTIQNG